MFTNPLSESVDRKTILQDIDGDTMIEILRYIYTRNVQNIETLASGILYGAEKYGLTKLKIICAETMIKKVSVHNVIDYFILAELHNEKTLMNHCLKLIHM